MAHFFPGLLPWMMGDIYLNEYRSIMLTIRIATQA